MQTAAQFYTLDYGCESLSVCYANFQQTLSSSTAYAIRAGCTAGNEKTQRQYECGEMLYITRATQQMTFPRALCATPQAIHVNYS